jgi:hypothetical protein
MTSTEKLPAPVKEKATTDFKNRQSAYGSKVTNALSDGLQRIFQASALLMGCAAILVFSLKERKLKAASPNTTPGVA